jgi:hypothetical protein
MSNSARFSYPADLPLGIGNRHASQQTPRDSKVCFSYYSAEMPLGIRNRSAAQRVLRQSPSGVGTICFNYVTTARFSPINSACFRY